MFWAGGGAKRRETFSDKSEISDGLTRLGKGFQRSVMMTLEEQFRSQVGAFLERTGLGPTTFGLKAVGDRNLIGQMEGGRSPSLRSADRVLAFVAGYDGDSGGTRDPPRRPRYREHPPRAGRAKRSEAATDQPRNGKTRAPTRILRLPEVQARAGLSRTTIYRWRVAGRFPQAVPLGTRNVGWIESELEEWIERMAERRGGAVGAAR